MVDENIKRTVFIGGNIAGLDVAMKGGEGPLMRRRGGRRAG